MDPDHVTGKDIPLNALPHWALCAAPKQNPYLAQFAALATRDGRQTGNAVVADFVTKVYHLGTKHEKTVQLIKVVTDAGDILLCTENGLKTLFHEPRWIMRNLLPAHVQALKDEIHSL
jgi:hypothetical protein